MSRDKIPDVVMAKFLLALVLISVSLPFYASWKLFAALFSEWCELVEEIRDIPSELYRVWRNM